MAQIWKSLDRHDNKSLDWLEQIDIRDNRCERLCAEDSEEVRSNVEKYYIPWENACHQEQTICRDTDLKATAGSAPRLDLENVALEGSEESEEMPLEGGREGSILHIGRKLSEAGPADG